MEPTLFYFLCRTLMVLGFLLAILDAASTIAALAFGGREANPLWRWAMGILGPYWVIPRLLLGLAIVWVNVGTATAPYVWYAIPAAVVPLLVMGYVVFSNFRIAHRLREKARSELR